MSSTSRLGGRLVTALAGLVFIVVLLGLAAVGVASGFGVFTSSTTVTADVPEAGPALGPGAEVQYRGVLVGSLASLRREPTHAVLTLHLDPSQVEKIPAGVTVRLVPRSVFGDLYVDLVPPAVQAGHIEPGAVLRANTSRPTVELDQALDAGYRLLTSVQPAKLSATLTAISTALEGRGAKLGALVDQAAHYTGQVAPDTGQLIHDITTIGTVGRQLAANSPALFRTLDDSIAISKAIAADQPTIARVLDAAPVVASQTNELLASNRAHLTTVVHQLHPVIRVLDGHQLDLENAVLQLEQFVNGAARALGHGPYLKVTVAPDVQRSRGASYTAANCPRYAGMKGANCAGRSPSQSAASAAAAVQALVDKAAGVSGSRGGRSRRPGVRQRLAIADVLLAPTLESLGGLLP